MAVIIPPAQIALPDLEKALLDTNNIEDGKFR